MTEKSLRATVSEMHDDIIKIKSDIAEIKDCLKGDDRGNPGLVEEVENQKTFIEGMRGQIDLAKWMLGGGVIFSIFSVGLSLWVIFHP